MSYLRKYFKNIKFDGQHNLMILRQLESHEGMCLVKKQLVKDKPVTEWWINRACHQCTLRQGNLK